MYKILNGLSRDIMEDIFETSTILVMRQHFPREILKELDTLFVLIFARTNFRAFAQKHRFAREI